MLTSLLSFFSALIVFILFMLIMDYKQHKKDNTLKETFKEYIIDLEQTHKKTIRCIGIVAVVILGILILINLGLYFRDGVANTVGGGFTIANAKRIAGIVGIISFVVVLIFNIIKGSFSISKFFGGFNVFTGSVQGKLIYYAVLLILGYGLFHQLTRATVDYNTDYKNNIKGNRDVYIDQRVGEACQEKCLVAVQPFGITILKVGCSQSCEASITQQNKSEDSKTYTGKSKGKVKVK